MTISAPEFRARQLYFNQAERDRRASAGQAIFTCHVAKSFPWDSRLRPELTPNWRDLGNAPNVDEYVRRQGMTAQDYAALLDRLKRDFPSESFLIVRYGDHQPEFAHLIIDPAVSDAERARQSRHTTALFHELLRNDAVNFKPVDLSSACRRWSTLSAAAGAGSGRRVPLDPSFAEQRRFCNAPRRVLQLRRRRGGAPFSRLLIEGGLIKGL